MIQTIGSGRCSLLRRTKRGQVATAETLLHEVVTLGGCTLDALQIRLSGGGVHKEAIGAAEGLRDLGRAEALVAIAQAQYRVGVAVGPLLTEAMSVVTRSREIMHMMREVHVIGWSAGLSRSFWREAASVRRCPL